VELGELRGIAAEIARSVAAPLACETDRDARWPARAMEELGRAGLTGLHVPRHLGGLELGFEALVAATEELGQACASTSLVFGMHCVATKVIATKATQFQEDRYLRPIAAGEHVTTLALSEPGTGAHFYLPQTTFADEGDEFVLHGAKSFVTSGGYADSHVMSAVAAQAVFDPGTFTCLVVDATSPNLVWGDAWDGFGMRGNSSRTVTLNGTRVPRGNLLGREGDETWYVFEVVAPYFLIAMSGTYLGIAQAALDHAVGHLTTRRYSHTHETVAEIPGMPPRIAGLWISVERARQLVYWAARVADAGAEEARVALLACKAEVADTVVQVANEALSLMGGIAYSANGPVARCLRDARASHVMSPTTDLLKLWLGRSLLDLPLLAEA
jgi:isovaleryl-CoA dehydrogenase